MGALLDTERVSFVSGGTRCAGWLTLPAGRGPHPGIVLAHGLGATHGMLMAQYEQHFAGSGIATLSFDYRHTGESDGEPRQRFCMRRHRRDVEAGLDYLRGHAGIDAARVGLWGTSLGALHVLQTAARRVDVAAVVVQCPIVHGPATLRRTGFRPVVRMTPAVVCDAFRRIFGAGREYVPIVGDPGSRAAVTVEGAREGWYSTVPPGCTFDNRIAATDVIGITFASAKRRSAKITAPLLVCVSQGETLMDPRHAEDIAETAPRGVVRHYDGDHFQIYHSPLLGELLADQTAFFQENLGVRVP
ncbi:alpha/beta hydrolase [Mycobacterium sp. 852002-50816_SCH5313054-b]|uniref:alpha/beta hydrolase n=1 Tax=Mycobacterium sp. 852002-50816_SCH5313054-b TaxID=1834092 RepID=UPI0007FECEDF|nr:alpha/beta hydrolase [Mycobacterium sp. 852002-50816_SCH5313054-b]OBF55146.1 alpha/beta hydrolase [Mycobacterium sp. 852002-50816_SCH5313054-b]